MEKQIPVRLAVVLVALRLAIGWHFFIEGVKKVESQRTGKTTTAEPWSSAEYLRGSAGPFADFFRAQAGDPDAEALAYLDASKPEAGEKTLARCLPAKTSKLWDDYFEKFAQHYQLSDSEGVAVSYLIDLPFIGPTWVPDKGLSTLPQKDLARRRLEEAKERAAQWMLGLNPADVYEVDRQLDNTTVKIKKSPKERIEDYRNLVREINKIEKSELPAFDRPVRKDLAQLKSEARELRTTLMKDLDRILTDRLTSILTPEQKKKGILPVERPRTWMLAFSDAVIPWGLVVVGACLLLGVFSRTAALLGLVFLLMIYLSLPPLLSVPPNPRLEGFYLYVNKNLIELLGLLALVMVPTGRWVGLDAVISRIRLRKKKPETTTASTDRQASEVRKG